MNRAVAERLESSMNEIGQLVGSVVNVFTEMYCMTIGVELPGSASGTFHLTFSVLLHFNGRFFSMQ